MSESGVISVDIDLAQHGLSNLNQVFANLDAPSLVEHAVVRREGMLSLDGPLVVRTGHHTGRSANDKFVVQDDLTRDEVWWGKINRPYDEQRFDELHRRMAAYLQLKDVYVKDCFVGADPRYRLPVRVVTENAWHNLFAHNMFIRGTAEELQGHQPEFTVLNAPRFHAIPEVDGTNSETFIIVNFKKKLVLIGGTSYAGEIKKSIFTVMNYVLPLKGVLPMHCSANIGPNGDSALFFGLSGTGKTTLSADASRTLIGDDEHGWSDDGVFNFEGGCYAKLIKLSPAAEPEIFGTTKRFGSVLENVAMDAHSRQIDLDDASFTENTRGAYPIHFIPNASESGVGGHPRNVVFLTADAFGVLPPISRLSKAQAMYHYLLGYTAKVAGTEKGVTEPTPNFSACYGAPFLPLHPGRYATLLGEKIDRHDVKVWLVNTGWSGGGYGEGERIAIRHTRAMVNAALSGALDNVATRTHPIFGLDMPTACPEVPAEILDPVNTWSDPAKYREQAVKVARSFVENFATYADQVSEEVRRAGPTID